MTKGFWAFLLTVIIGCYATDWYYDIKVTMLANMVTIFFCALFVLWCLTETDQ